MCAPSIVAKGSANVVSEPEPQGQATATTHARFSIPPYMFPLAATPLHFTADEAGMIVMVFSVVKKVLRVVGYPRDRPWTGQQASIQLPVSRREWPWSYCNGANLGRSAFA